jgi:hypothetical protein
VGSICSFRITRYLEIAHSPMRFESTLRNADYSGLAIDCLDWRARQDSHMDTASNKAQAVSGSDVSESKIPPRVRDN